MLYSAGGPEAGSADVVEELPLYLAFATRFCAAVKEANEEMN